ncbi:maltokinase N-terminal cap-like domain-containing protein [Streptacidiphilus fuscans]|uniref:1,4-alpha-glucan branching protein n=1 Tax=Streptacidiphilus fuscans TaxID=2789292 RepID=A0A931B3Q4_9ACTN|nr:1,4-alpha-glucan branching protein [Streptacidiphilus fuscans]MBF9070559.1 1,4-alpha-glucan branching protein [Streptacidiphilus fuscans]
MAEIHRTTLTPNKLELLTAWLPQQSWYLGDGADGPTKPELSRAGGFRLDDPEGEVGIEFAVVLDSAGPEQVAYLVPMAYRDAPLADAPEEALIGTAEHGVLGTRYVYDGAQDPVVTAQLRALLRGEAIPQAQSVSDTVDPTVTVQGFGSVDGAADGAVDRVEIVRVLHPGTPEDEPSLHVAAGWTPADETTARGVFARVQGRA